MDNSKKAAFVRAMGKRQKFSKGGLIRKLGNRHYFDDGGTVLSGPGSNTTGNNSQTVNNNGLTGTVNNLLGLNNQFQAQSAQIQQGTNAAQLNAAYQGAQGGIGQQQALANQLAAQGAQGMGTQAALTGQLEGIINGTGPNAAQTALNQNTAQNVNQQAALMAGQRGAGANVGLLARQNAMTGAGIQQNAVGQAATLQAQQQIAAQQQLQDLAQSQIGQQAAAIQGVNNAQQNEQNILQGANTAANNAAVTMQSNINNVNAGVAAGNQQQANNGLGMIGSLASAAPSAFSSAAGAIGGLFAHGGEVPMMASGGPLTVNRMSHSQSSAPWLQSANAGAAMAPNAGTAPAPVNLKGPQFKDMSWDTSKPAPLQTPGAVANAGNNYATAANDFGTAPGSDPNHLGAAPLTMPDSSASSISTPAPSLGASIPSASSSPGSFFDLKAKGGEVQYFDNGGWLNSQIDTGAPASAGNAPTAPASQGKGGGLGSLASLAPLIMAAYKGGPIHPDHYHAHCKNYFSGGKAKAVPAMVSPGEVYLSPEKVRQVVEEGKNPLKIGEHIKGKAKIKGDSLKNDTVPKTLEEGGVVIPRHVMNKMSPEKAELFVHRAIARKKVGGKS